MWLELIKLLNQIKINFTHCRSVGGDGSAMMKGLALAWGEQHAFCCVVVAKGGYEGVGGGRETADTFSECSRGGR